MATVGVVPPSRVGGSEGREECGVCVGADAFGPPLSAVGVSGTDWRGVTAGVVELPPLALCGTTPGARGAVDGTGGAGMCACPACPPDCCVRTPICEGVCGVAPECGMAGVPPWPADAVEGGMTPGGRAEGEEGAGILGAGTCPAGRGVPGRRTPITSRSEEADEAGWVVGLGVGCAQGMTDGAASWAGSDAGVGVDGASVARGAASDTGETGASGGVCIAVGAAESAVSTASSAGVAALVVRGRRHQLHLSVVSLSMPHHLQNIRRFLRLRAPGCSPGVIKIRAGIKDGGSLRYATAQARPTASHLSRWVRARSPVSIGIMGLSGVSVNVSRSH